MKQIAFVVFVVLGYAGPAAAQKLSDEEIKDGFVSLFNGKDWSGWQFGGGHGLPEKVPANWTIKDGVIHLTGGGAPHLGRNGITTTSSSASSGGRSTPRATTTAASTSAVAARSTPTSSTSPRAARRGR